MVKAVGKQKDRFDVFEKLSDVAVLFGNVVVFYFKVKKYFKEWRA